MRRSADRIADMIEKAMGNLLRRGIPADSIVNQIAPGALPPATGTTPGGVVLSDATPASVAAAGAAGSGADASRSDHAHAHGNQAGGSLHSAATTSVAGFQSAADKTKEDAYPAISGLTTGHVLTATGASAAAFQVPAFVNPMTTQDDLIVGGASGVPARLAKGSDSQVLTVDPSTHHLVWATPSSGLSNPMTTEGDLIRGGASGTPTRVAVGASGKILTSDGTDPVWGNGPLTTRGDIITAAASGAIQRLALGSSGKILTSDGTDAVWGNGPLTTKGDVIAGGASGAISRLAVGTDGYVLVADSTQTIGVKWASVSGSGGAGGAPSDAEYVTTAASGGLSAEVAVPGLAGSPDRAAAAGAGFSDEFDTNSDPFTWSPSAPATHDSDTTVPSYLYLQSTDNTVRIGTQSWAPAGAFDIRMFVTGGVEVANSEISIGIHVGDSGNNNRALIMLGPISSQAYTWGVRAFTYASGSYTQRGSTWLTYNNKQYLRITRDGSNNLSFYRSLTGQEGTWVFIATQALTFTVANRGLYFSIGNSSVTGQAAIDWQRASV